MNESIFKLYYIILVRIFEVGIDFCVNLSRLHTEIETTSPMNTTQLKPMIEKLICILFEFFIIIAGFESTKCVLQFNINKNVFTQHNGFGLS